MKITYKSVAKKKGGKTFFVTSMRLRVQRLAAATRSRGCLTFWEDIIYNIFVSKERLEFPPVMHDKKSKIDFFLASRQKCFDVKDVMALYNSLLALPDERIDKLFSLQLVSPRIAFILSVFLGVLGVDRFYCRSNKLGIAKLFTIAACGFWWVGDLFVIREAARLTNYKILRNFIINPVKEEDAD